MSITVNDYTNNANDDDNDDDDNNNNNNNVNEMKLEKKMNVLLIINII